MQVCKLDGNLLRLCLAGTRASLKESGRGGPAPWTAAVRAWEGLQEATLICSPGGGCQACTSALVDASTRRTSPLVTWSSWSATVFPQHSVCAARTGTHQGLAWSGSHRFTTFSGRIAEYCTTFSL